MTTINWRNTKSGDWNFGSNWDWGIVPTASEDVVFGLAGPYVVTIDATAVARSLIFNAAGATLDETTGSLAVSSLLTIEAGEVSLDGTNSIGRIDIDDGVLAISSSGALGGSLLEMFGGELVASATATLADALQLDGVDQIAVATGATLTLTGTADLNGGIMVFGSSGASGAVVWDAQTVSLAASASANLDVRAGTLTFGNPDLGLATAGDAWTSIDVESGATLNLGGSTTTVDMLAGSGTIINTGGFGGRITVGGGSFGGTIGDDIALAVTTNLTLYGDANPADIILSTGAVLRNAQGGVIEFDNSGSFSTPNVGQASFRNDGTFLYGGLPTGGFLVSVSFNNEGFMANTGGAMTFTGGFTNGGVVEGLLNTNGDGSVTWTADAAGAPLTYVGGNDDDVFSLSAAPGDVNGGSGTNTIDALASMTFTAGSVVNVQRFVIANKANVNLSALTSAETVIIASQPGGGASVTGTSGIDTFTANSGDDRITFGPASGNLAKLDATNGAWDSVFGSNGAVNLDDAQTNVTGGGDTVLFVGAAGSGASLYGTEGLWDTVKGAGGAVTLNDAEASVFNGGDTVYLNGTSGNDVSLYETGAIVDNVYGSDAVIQLTAAEANLTGGGDAIYFAAHAGESIALSGTSGAWDNVFDAGAVVTLDGAQANLTGGGDTLTFGVGAHNQASLYATGGAWDSVYGAGAVVTLIGAQASLTGAGDTVYFDGGSGDAVSLYATAGVWDNVYGTGASVTLNNADANLIAGGDTAYFSGGAGESVTALGNSEFFVFGASLGASWISGFNATDKIQFSKSDFANYAALTNALSPSGANVVIKLDAGDSVTLANVSTQNLTSSQFTFV